MAPGRNERCPCGSGRKYKHCCGAPAGQSRQAAGPASSASSLAIASRLLQSGQSGQAERICQEVLAREPANAQATHFFGMSLVQAGRLEEGVAALKRSVVLDPSNDMYWLNMGMVWLQLNELGEAEASLRRALSCRPDSPTAHNYLGVAMLRSGRNTEAVTSFERALALNPADDAIHNNFGYARLEHGEVEAACALFRRAIEINPNNAMAHNNLGNALHALGDMAGRVACYERAVAIDPGNAMARFNLGRALADAGQPEAALAQLRAAVRLAPQTGTAWQWLADVLGQMRFDAWDARAEHELVACLSRPDIEPAHLAQATASLLRADPSFKHLLPPSGGDDIRGLALDQAALLQLARPVFLLLLESAVICDPDFERLVTRARRAALLAWKAKNPGSDASLAAVLAAIAHQCFLTEYLHEERDDELSMVGELQAELDAEVAQAGPLNEAQLALFACYRPLGVLQGAGMLAASDASVFGRLVMRQVREPAEEVGIAASLPSLTPISDAVSRAVRTQYEQHPYPRWLRAPSTGGAYPLARRLRTLFPHADKASAGLEKEHPSILIAGCGTGRHVAITAALNPDSRILAIDLSRASLAYAARRARESGLRNVEFAQADIVELGRLEERFDVIECSGVLHHLNDPVAGWRVLTGLLAPGGRMKVGLYSEAGRRGVAAARRLIADAGFAADAPGMRAARAAILALPAGNPARHFADSIDFYSLSGCRDLLFHVQEHRFTLPWIEGILHDLGLEFLGFEFESALMAYRSEFPLDRAATSLANWAEFEARHPDTFAAMYQFWVTPKQG